MSDTLPLDGPDPTRLPDGSPRPVHPGSGKPVMTEREANWHAHVSGLAERQEVERRDPAAEPLLDAGTRPQATPEIIGGIELWPMSIGHFLALEKLGSAYASQDGGALGILDVALAALVFHRPEWCWETLQAGGRHQLDAEASRLAFKLTAPVLREINAFIESEMAEFADKEGHPEKKSRPTEEPPPSPSSSTPAAPPQAGPPA